MSQREQLDTSTLTYHGTTFTHNRNSQKSGGKTVRQRRNSIRRLDHDTLSQLATMEPQSLPLDDKRVHRDVFIKQAAQREIETRAGMKALSLQQAKEHNRWTKPLDEHGVSAMRFATSLAEEANDQVRKESISKDTDSHPEKFSTPQQLGVTQIGNVVGVGFSGGEDDNAQSSAFLMGRMVELNKHHNETVGLPSSTRFEAIAVPDVEPEVTQVQKKDSVETRKRVCAAHRSTAAAMAANGELDPQTPVKRSQLRPDVATMEVSSSAYGKSPNFSERNYSSNTKVPNQQDPSSLNTSNRNPKIFEELDHDHIRTKKSAPKRRNSFSAIMNSCPGCRIERASFQ